LTLDLATRSGLPDDLRYLVEKYPREVWGAHANLGEMARFWLQRHDMFRELGTMLGEATGAYRSGATGADEFRRFTPRRLQFFLSQLQTHHHIEDHHYFPVFVRAEAGLARGFALLDSDHHVIDGQLVAVAEAANGLLGEMAATADARPSADAYAHASERLIRHLARHLEDEEDLIVPVILDRGEGALGLY
jgi:hypothetical protein